MKASRFGVKSSVPGWREVSEQVSDLLCKHEENSHKADRCPVSITPAPPPQKGRLRQEDLQKLPGHHTWHCLKPGRRGGPTLKAVLLTATTANALEFAVTKGGIPPVNG